MSHQGPPGAPPPPPAAPPPPGASVRPALDEETKKEIAEIKENANELLVQAKNAVEAYKIASLEKGVPAQVLSDLKKVRTQARKEFDDFKSKYQTAFQEAEKRDVAPIKADITEIEQRTESLQKRKNEETKELRARFNRLKEGVEQNQALIDEFSEIANNQGKNVAPFIEQIEEENRRLLASKDAIDLERDIQAISEKYDELIIELQKSLSKAQKQLKIANEKLIPLKAKAEAIPKYSDFAGAQQGDEKRIENVLGGFIDEWFKEGGSLRREFLLHNLSSFVSKDASEDRDFLLHPERLASVYKTLSTFAGVDIQTLANIAIGVYKRPAGTRCVVTVGEKQFMTPLEVHEDLYDAADIFIATLRRGAGLGAETKQKQSSSRVHAQYLIEAHDIEPVFASARPLPTSNKDKEKEKEKEKEVRSDKNKSQKKEKWDPAALEKELEERQKKNLAEEKEILAKVGTHYGKRGAHKDESTPFGSIAAGLRHLDESFVFIENSLNETRVALAQLGDSYYQGEGDIDIAASKAIRRLDEEKRLALEQVEQEKRKAALLAAEAEHRGFSRGISENKTPADILKSKGLNGFTAALDLYKAQHQGHNPSKEEVKKWGSFIPQKEKPSFNKLIAKYKP